MDDYRILIGAAPTTEQKQKLLADSLRRRRAFGELGAVTGDRVLQPFGHSLREQADEYAKMVQDTRQKDIDDAQTKAYQTGQLEHMGQVLKETMRGNNLDYAAAMAAIAQRDRSDMLSAFGSEAEYRKFTDSTRNKMISKASVMEGIMDSIATFKPEYTQILGAGPQSKLPNTLAGYGIGTQNSKAAQLWWANWDKFFTLPERNQTFGATLTPNEQQAWKEVSIHPGMDPEIIQHKLNKFLNTIRGETIRRIRSMEKEGFDPEVLDTMHEDVIPKGMLLNRSRGPQGRRGGTVRETYSTSTPEYTTEDIMEGLRRIDEELNSNGR